MTEVIGKRYLISGRVQGVFYRESTRRKAESLGITGSAINLADGRVQVLAWGPSSALSELEAWLWSGPRMAKVSDVQSRDYPEHPPQEFRTG